MNLSIKPVDVAHVVQVWPMVETFIVEAFEKGRDSPPEAWNYTIEHVRAFLASGQWLLLVAIDDKDVIHGAATVSFLNYPMQRVAFVTAIGGRMIGNRETFDKFKALLKVYGATKIQGYGRESIVRLWKRLSFEPRGTLVEIMI
jgi:hypothetical protein